MTGKYKGCASVCSLPLFTANDISEIDWTLTCVRASSCIEGVWTNGQLSNAKWRHADGGSFHGEFSKNAPNGTGVLFTAKGEGLRGCLSPEMIQNPDDDEKLVATGKSTWSPVDFKTEPIPPIRKRLERNIRCGKPRVDNEDGALSLSELSGGMPRVYGMGTPSLEAFPELIKKAKAAEAEKVFVYVTRADPVAFLKTVEGPTLSFSPCLLSNPCQEINFTAGEVAPAEGEDEDKFKYFKSLGLKWVDQLSSNDGSVVCYTANGEKKEIKVDSKAPLMCLTTSRPAPEEGTPGPAEVKSFLGNFAETEDEAMCPVEFALLPLPRGSPSAEGVDGIIKALKERNLSGEAIVFMNRDGEGAVPFAMIVSGLVHLVKNPPAAAEEEKKEEEAEKKEGEKEVKEEENAPAPAPAPKVNDLSKGEYPVIMDIVNAVPEGKGVALKEDVDNMIKKCAPSFDLFKSIAEKKDAFKAAEAKKGEDWEAGELAKNSLEIARDSLRSYATLLTSYIFMKVTVEDEDATYAAWIKAPEQEALNSSIEAISTYMFS